jgi:hypothetical protein
MFSKLLDLADKLAAGISRNSVQPGRRSFLRATLEASGAVAAFLGFAQLSPAQAGNCNVAGGDCTIGGVPCTATGAGPDLKTANGRFQADLYNKCLAYCKSRADCGKSRSCCPYGPWAPNINCVTDKGQVVCTADEIYCWCECYPAKGTQCTAHVAGAVAAKVTVSRQGRRLPID